MDAMRRMRAFSAVQSGEMELQSGRFDKEMLAVPLEKSVAEVRAALREKVQGEPDAMLLDVREQDEFAFCRIEGAVLIPLSEMKFSASPVLPKTLRLAPRKPTPPAPRCAAPDPSGGAQGWTRCQPTGKSLCTATTACGACRRTPGTRNAPVSLGSRRSN
jgi:hypothetical protein